MLIPLFICLYTLLVVLSISVNAQPNKGQTGPKVDDYTKRLIKEMQGQGVPKEAIIDRIKYSAKGVNNAKKIVDNVSEDKMKEAARNKQRKAQANQASILASRKKEAQKKMNKANSRREL